MASLYEDYTEEELITKYSNGCSGYIPHIYWSIRGKKEPYLYCCDVHDVAYEEGGTEADRKLADERFRDCIVDYYSKTWSKIMYLFVRMFGRFKFRYHV